jgi:hypothetical protein
VSKAQADSSERRKHPRLTMDLPIALFAGDGQEPLRAVLRNLSRGGLFLETKLEVAERAPVFVRFRVRPDRVCEALGRVVHVSRTRALRGFGVEFQQRNDAFEDFLVILEHLQPQAHTQLLAKVLNPQIELKTEVVDTTDRTAMQRAQIDGALAELIKAVDDWRRDRDSRELRRSLHSALRALDDLE